MSASALEPTGPGEGASSTAHAARLAEHEATPFFAPSAAAADLPYATLPTAAAAAPTSAPPAAASAAAAPSLLAPPSYPVYLLEDRLHLSDTAREDEVCSGAQCAPELGGVDGLVFGAAQAQRTLDEAEAIVARWSKEPGGWSDAARSERWHLAGRMDLGL